MRVALVAVMVLLFMAACVHKPFVTIQPHVPDNSCDGITPSYSRDIQPVFTATCAKAGCHDGIEMPLDFSVYGQIEHYLVDSAVYYYVVLNRTMPQDQPLDSAQFLQVKCWLKDGYPNN